MKQGVNVKKENQILMWLSSDKISFMKWLYTQLSLIKSNRIKTNMFDQVKLEGQQRETWLILMINKFDRKNNQTIN